ncbi:MAG: prepilin-type N-terminal cleavage/methylation domain-containing protein [Endomicrobium sp.]|jgi:prepilin-type N-terminal cleavage/methylation domain-containing protein|nr:prepilin-type N-terminal cleavage/methylation domain-containing protein [Endomicrobium sp.]
MKAKKGFTFVELAIVIVIVTVLSLAAVPIYRGYVRRAYVTEGRMLVNAIIKAESAYCSENGTYYPISSPVEYDTVLGIDARENSYFDKFYVGVYNDDGTQPNPQDYPLMTVVAEGRSGTSMAGHWVGRSANVAGSATFNRNSVENPEVWRPDYTGAVKDNP